MTLLAPTRDEMVDAFLKSDGSYDGLFYTAVRTTGIFCIPSCRARKPLPQNVEFFETAREALFSGYRPCKRCRPMESNGAAPEWLRPLLEAIEQDPRQRWRDAELTKLGMEPARVRRHFRQPVMPQQNSAKGLIAHVGHSRVVLRRRRVVNPRQFVLQFLHVLADFSY